VSFEVRLSPLATADLLEITDQRTTSALEKRIDKLQVNPIEQGKPMRGPLQGFYSVRAAGQRYRIIYEVRVLPADQRTQLTQEGGVLVLVIGIRKEGDKNDVYTVAENRLG
jgi:mRNA interferase RelE/StbE